MKTLIFNGSPRKNGDTISLINILTRELKGESMVVDCCHEDISPCMDCRHCQNKEGCAIDDRMQEIYPFIEECDNVVIASHIYFSMLTGKLLDVASRLQMYYCTRLFRGEDTGIAPKRGGVILVGGGDGEPDRAFTTAKTLLHHMNAHDIFPLVCSHDTNNRPAAEDEEAVRKVVELAAYLNETIR